MTQRLQLGDDVFAAVPATHARRVAYVLGLGAGVLRSRDGVAGLGWLDELLSSLRMVDAEHRSAPPASVSGSASRTRQAPDDVRPALWAHDTVTIAEAADITGWSASYLCRLARTGLGHKRGGVWQLDRDALLARRGPPQGSRQGDVGGERGHQGAHAHAAAAREHRP